MEIVFVITLFTTYAVAQKGVITGDGMPPDGSTVPAGSALTLTCSCSQDASSVSFWQKSLTDVSPTRRMRMVIENTGNCLKIPSGLSNCTCVNQQLYMCTIEMVELANKKDVWTCKCNFGSLFVVSNKLIIDIAVGITGVSLSPLPPVKIIDQQVVNIVCTTTEGVPAAIVHWFRETSNGYSNITSLSNATSTRNANGLYVATSTLELRPSREDNLMRVYCNASNIGNWYISNMGTIEVLYGPDRPLCTYGSSPVSDIIRVIKGSTLNIQCSSTSNPQPNMYTWILPNSSMLVGAQLSVPNIQPFPSSGPYMIQVQNYMTPTMGETVQGINTSTLIVEVLYPPSKPHLRISLTSVTGTVKIIEGESYTFHCESDGNPAATYIWSHSRGHTYSNQSSLSLTKPVAANDEGEYVCRAENTLNPTGGPGQSQSSNSSLLVDILYGPTISAMSSQDVIRGNKVQQTCLFTPGNPVHTTFRWTRSSATYSWVVQTERTLVIDSAQRSDDSDYTCEVSNVLNRTVGASIIKKDSGSFHLNVLFGAEKLELMVSGSVGQKNVTVNEGEAHTFICSLESNPGSTMVIQKDGAEVVRALNSRILEYTNHNNCEDAGLYTCSGRNDHGTAVADSVQYFVKCSARPSPFVEINYNVSSPQAVNTTLSFYTQAYPDPQYTWQRCTDACINITNGTDYKITSNGLISNLIILNVEEQDYGSYKVMANNGIGAAWHETFQLIPYDKPSIPQSFHVVENTITPSEVILALTSGFNGGPQQTFHIRYKTTSAIAWLSTTVSDTGSIYMNVTIRDLRSGTAYQAYLFSENLMGSSPNTDVISFTTAQDQVSSTSSSKAGMIAGSIVGGLIALLVIVMTVIALRKYELMCTCKCVRMQGESDSLGNPNDIRRNQPDINNSGNDNELGTNAYDSLDAHQSDKHVYSELGLQSGTDQTHMYENSGVHLDSGAAVYVNAKFEKA